MKDDVNGAPGKSRQPSWKLLATAAAILAIVHACLAIEGRGIEGFLLWVIILFLGYWLLFQLLIWLSRKLRERS